MEHGNAYGLCKKIIAAGRINKEKMLSKLQLLMSTNDLTDDDYVELKAELGAE